LDSTAWAGAPLAPPPPPPNPLPSSYTPNDTAVICSYMLERNIAKNKHMTCTTDNRTYCMVLRQGYPLSSIKFIFTDFYYNFLGYIIIILTLIITVIHHNHHQGNT